jgi:hypothetical protein
MGFIEILRPSKQQMLRDAVAASATGQQPEPGDPAGRPVEDCGGAMHASVQPFPAAILHCLCPGRRGSSHLWLLWRRLQREMSEQTFHRSHTVGALCALLAAARHDVCCFDVLSGKPEVAASVGMSRASSAFFITLLSAECCGQDRPAGGGFYVCTCPGGFKLMHGRLHPFPRARVAPTMLVRSHYLLSLSMGKPQSVTLQNASPWKGVVEDERWLSISSLEYLGKGG